MQCSSCRFENMPGVEVCGRCGTSLRLATAVLDVHPPRARPWRKRVRRWFPARRAAIRLRDVAAEAREHLAAATGDVGVNVPEAGVLARFVVPGWAHFYLGMPMRGRLFLFLYLALLLAGLLFLGTTLGSILLGFAFSVHASAVLDIVLQTPGDVPSRLVTAAGVLLVLGLGVYAPARWLLGRVADPQAITQAIGPFREGDVVLVNHLAYLRSGPQPGDVVLYAVPEAYLPIAGMEHGNVNIQPGNYIDRVLAGPGAVVRWEDGRLLVDDERTEWQPLNPAGLPARLRLQVPAGEYLILPSTVNYRMHGNVRFPPNLWQQLACVPAGRIEGTAYLRLHPLSRLGRLR